MNHAPRVLTQLWPASARGATGQAVSGRPPRVLTQPGPGDPSVTTKSQRQPRVLTQPEPAGASGVTVETAVKEAPRVSTQLGPLVQPPRVLTLPGPPAAIGATGEGATGSPAWARWRDTQWVGKKLARVGLDLKQQIRAHPGWLGEFCRATQHTTDPYGEEARHAAADLLPLPCTSTSVEEDEWRARQSGRRVPEGGEKASEVLEHAAGVKAWLWCVVCALNYMHAGRGRPTHRHQPVQGPASDAQSAALGRLEADVLYFLERNKGVVPDADWPKLLLTRRVGYDGQEVGAAQPVELRRVLPALPSAENCGRICATEIATGQVREALLDPGLTVKPQGAWPLSGLRARCQHVRADRDAIVKELLSRGMCTAMPRKQLIHGNHGPIENGWFGVGKGKYLPGCPPDPLHEVLRLIMNFVPVNSILEPITGDVSTLPYMGQWTSLQLLSWQYFSWSSEGISCMFYIFRVPAAWAPYMAFSCGNVARFLKEPENVDMRLCARVLGMGWLSSVGVAQHLIRELTLRAPTLGAGLPAGAELRRDVDLPGPGAQGDGAYEFWSVYMDDFDTFEAGEKEAVLARVGETHRWQEAVRKAYSAWGIPRGSDKAVCRSLQAERLGASLDGVAGRAQGTPSKLLMLVGLMDYLLKLEAPPRGLVEMLAGRFVHRMQFRRPCMSGLSRIWKYLRRWGFSRELPAEVEEDFALSLALAPLMFMDFRTPIHEQVSCSDASPDGTGMCVSVGCTRAGVGAAHKLATPAPRTNGPGVNLLLVSLFDGIGGLRRSVEVAGGVVYGSVAVESNSGCRRVVENAWPDTCAYPDVQAFSGDTVRELRLKFPRTTHILLGAGFPCQQFSGLNEDRAGLRSPGGQLVYEIPRCRKLLQEGFGVPVELLAECVASMEAADCATISGVLGAVPVKCCSRGVAWCRRPRLYWVSWPLATGTGVSLQEGHQQHHASLSADRGPWEAWARPGWRPPSTDVEFAFLTFTRALPEKSGLWKKRGLDKLCPEGRRIWTNERFRFAPYQFQASNLMSCGTKKRTLAADEREVIMGYEPGHTAPLFPKADRSKALDYEDARCAAVGNSWCIQVTAWLAGEYLASIGWLATMPKLAEIVRRCLPRRVQAQMAAADSVTAPASVPQQLISGVFKAVDHTGGLIRKSPGTCEPPHVATMRPVDPRWWRWRVVVSWPWPKAVRDEHINKLELRSLLTSLRWRARRANRQNFRMLHLADSRVTIGVANKARSSSYDLQRLADKVASTQLAAGLRLVLGFVSTKLNPADWPSRARALWASKRRKKRNGRAGAKPAGQP